MHSYLVLFAVSLVICSEASAETKKWKVYEFPHPVYQHRECGNKEGEVAWICDPDIVISSKDADDIQNMLAETYTNSQCCASCKGEHKGYVIMVAIMARMQKMFMDSNDTVADLRNAKIYAYYLSLYWNITNCEELVLILFSRDDDILYTVTWKKAREVLTDRLVTEITMNARAHILSKKKQDIGKGLKMLVKNYSDVFANKYKHG